MKTIVFVGLMLILWVVQPLCAQVQKVDRYHSNLTETKLNGLDVTFKKIDARFDNIDRQFIYHQKQLDDLKTILYWGFGLLISLFISMFVYLIWDRHILRIKYNLI
jgi:hypothetical protein